MIFYSYWGMIQLSIFAELARHCSVYIQVLSPFFMYMVEGGHSLFLLPRALWFFGMYGLRIVSWMGWCVHGALTDSLQFLLQYVEYLTHFHYKCHYYVIDNKSKSIDFKNTKFLRFQALKTKVKDQKLFKSAKIYRMQKTHDNTDSSTTSQI